MDFFNILIAFTLFMFVVYITASKIYFYNKTEYIKSNIYDKTYLVKNTENKYEKVKLIDQLLESLNILIGDLKTNEDLNIESDFEDIQNRLINSEVLENITNSDTSYTVNKGEKIVICLADRDTDKLYSYNLLMYVLLHELAHIINTTYGHDENFKKVFKIITQRAIDLNLYTYEDYKKSPKNYCGLTLNTSII